MTRRFPLDFHCPECDALARAMLEARQADLDDLRKHLLDTARATGRGPIEMRDAWLSSIVTMPDDEMRTVMQAHHPREAEARRRIAEHEAATGHPVSRLCSSAVLGYRGTMK